MDRIPALIAQLLYASLNISLLNIRDQQQGSSAICIGTDLAIVSSDNGKTFGEAGIEIRLRYERQVAAIFVPDLQAAERCPISCNGMIQQILAILTHRQWNFDFWTRFEPDVLQARQLALDCIDRLGLH